MGRQHQEKQKKAKQSNSNDSLNLGGSLPRSETPDRGLEVQGLEAGTFRQVRLGGRHWVRSKEASCQSGSRWRARLSPGSHTLSRACLLRSPRGPCFCLGCPRPPSWVRARVSSPAGPPGFLPKDRAAHCPLLVGAMELEPLAPDSMSDLDQ